MLELSRFRRLLVYLALYVVGLLVQLVGFSAPYWEVSSDGRSHSGLWLACHNGTCWRWEHEDLALLEGVEDLPVVYCMLGQTVMASGLLLTLMTGAAYASWVTQHKDHRLMVLSTCCMVFAGLFNVTAVVVYGTGQARSKVRSLEYGLGWAFWCCTASAGVLFLAACLLILDRCVLVSNFEHRRMSYSSEWTDKSGQSSFRGNPRLNPAVSYNGSTNGIARLPTVSTISTLAGPSLTEMNSLHSLPAGLRDSSLGVPVKEGSAAQPWTAGSGQLF